jgi:hypothetical protein
MNKGYSEVFFEELKRDLRIKRMKDEKGNVVFG